MNDVASLELSKELYELSGWSDTTRWWHDKSTGEQDVIGIHDTFDAVRQNGDVCPAYSLGYLLRKLQEHPRIELRQLSGRRWVAERLWGELQSDESAKKCLIAEVGDTPEDALCQLAIELFKQGVLKKEDDVRATD